MTSKSEAPYERHFQRKVLKKLRTIPFSYWEKINDQTTIGILDIVGCVSGLFFSIELKTRSKESKIQRVTARKISRSKGVAMIVTPDNFDDAFQRIRMLGSMIETFSLVPPPGWEILNMERFQ